MENLTYSSTTILCAWVVRLAGYDRVGEGRLEVWQVDIAARTVVQTSSSVRDIAVKEEVVLLSPSLVAVVEFDLDSALGCYKLTLSEFRLSVNRRLSVKTRDWSTDLPPASRQVEAADRTGHCFIASPRTGRRD